MKSQLIGKDPVSGKNRRQEVGGLTEDEMDGWHHRLNEEEFEQAPGDGKVQGSLACCSPWGCKESETTVKDREAWHGAVRGVAKSQT